MVTDTMDRPDLSASAPRHPIGVVARRTGLKPELIRAWERRYGVLDPARSPGNQRLYSEDDVDRLVWLQRLTATGWRIGQLAGYDTPALRQLAANETGQEPGPMPDGDTPRVPRRLETCLATIVRLESRQLAFHLERAAIDLGPTAAVVELVAPLLERVNELRASGELRLMHEQLARAAMRSFLSEIIGRANAHLDSGPQVLVATPPGHPDDMGALLTAAVASSAGWRVTHIGTGLPAEEIVAAVHQTGSAAVALGIGRSAADARVGGECARIARLLEPMRAIVVSTRADVVPEVEDEQLEPLQLAELHAELSRPLPRTPRVADPAAADNGSAAFLHVHRAAQRLYGLEGWVLGVGARLPLPELATVRRIAQRINEVREVERHPHRGVSAGQLSAAGLLHDLGQRLILAYDAATQSDVMRTAVSWLDERFGWRTVNDGLGQFRAHFGAPLAGGSDDGPAAHGGEFTAPSQELTEMLLVWLANHNPCLSGLRDLFDDSTLRHQGPYRHMMESLETFFAKRPEFAGSTLLGLLCAPVTAAPDSLVGQLEQAIRVQEDVLGLNADRFRLVLDVLREEHRPPAAAAPAPPTREPTSGDFAALLEGDACYSPDAPWMPGLVLVAKHTLVWLDQLSRNHGRAVERLDQVPDEELDRLADLGLNGLWLVGMWARSSASARIKQSTGNPEAVASAYSLDAYRVADELGGPAALDDLRTRAGQRGIRIGCDMVPNHTGIDSRWVVEHPERFLSLAASPYPGYTFTGPDLCQDDRVGVYIADQYYDRSDAAVVFKRVDRATGGERYIYHGNDGTGLPWNDTAQIDYLDQEAREAVVRTIVEVARQFPIVRFDAAMALVREHIQRLWYPAPGTGGAIPSRSEHGLSPQEFERRMPEEFWRQVVEGIDEEAPGTMLVAEAFWLLEGYFVRSLGMHRVYNSACMHLLRDEDNAALQRLFRNLLELDPEILGHFVNFLTTPDERTAVEQFGKGDKYFGGCVLLATLPGLPLFGHGQIEGLTEKYGMEYRRAYYSETPDAALIARHQREIAPLLRRRASLAGVEHFRLLELETAAGSRDDNVLAFVNGSRHDRLLVLMHNHPAMTHGRLRHCAPYRDTDSDQLVEADLASALHLPASGSVVLRNLFGGGELVVDAREARDRGLEVHLGPYEYRIYEVREG
jgi:DNA-binding transcriptional MerR regulator/glycosidase